MKQTHRLSATTLIFLALISFSSCKKSATENKVSAANSSNATTYTLVWSDEFNGTSVNTADWNFETGGGGWGNNEKE